MAPPRSLDTLTHAVGEPRIGLRDRARRADMHPETFEPKSEEPPVCRRLVENQVQREGAVGRIGEERRVEDRNAGEDERADFAVATAPQPAEGVHGEIPRSL